MQELLAVTKALSDEGRVRVLMGLAETEMCVCQITELLGLATPTVSRHMAVLQRAGLVTSRKDGRWVYYRLAEAAEGSPAGLALAWLRCCLREDPAIASDRDLLRDICCCDPEDLCRKHRPAQAANCC